MKLWILPSCIFLPWITWNTQADFAREIQKPSTASRPASTSLRHHLHHLLQVPFRLGLKWIDWPAACCWVDRDLTRDFPLWGKTHNKNKKRCGSYPTSTDAGAKHAAIHSYGHDDAFPPPSPDGSPFSHSLARRSLALGINIDPLPNTKDKPKAHTSMYHKLGDAGTNAALTVGQVCQNKSILQLAGFFSRTKQDSFYHKKERLKTQNGHPYAQELPHSYGRATSTLCLLCHQLLSQIHMLSGCPDASKYGDAKT